jgi:hypothetical protein
MLRIQSVERSGGGRWTFPSSSGNYSRIVVLGGLVPQGPKTDRSMMFQLPQAETRQPGQAPAPPAGMFSLGACFRTHF